MKQRQREDRQNEAETERARHTDSLSSCCERETREISVQPTCMLDLLASPLLYPFSFTTRTATQMATIMMGMIMMMLKKTMLMKKMIIMMKMMTTVMMMMMVVMMMMMMMMMMVMMMMMIIH